jgi:hypothetical protein
VRPRLGRSCVPWWCACPTPHRPLLCRRVPIQYHASHVSAALNTAKKRKSEAKAERERKAVKAEKRERKAAKAARKAEKRERAEAAADEDA